MREETTEMRATDNVLICLGENGQMNSPQIAEKLGLEGDSAKAVGKYLRNLMRKLLVTVDKNMNYTLTKRGEKAFEKIMQEIPF